MLADDSYYYGRHCQGRPFNAYIAAQQTDTQEVAHLIGEDELVRGEAVKLQSDADLHRPGPRRSDEHQLAAGSKRPISTRATYITVI